MKIVAISDTHGKHDQLILPEGDMIIHAGDISRRGDQNEVEDFLDWFSHTDFKHKIFIAGNHDFFFEERDPSPIIPGGVIYLNDSGIEIGGIKIWGSPITPWFYDWAFNRQRGEEIRKHWELIPDGIDILITHGPAHGILDRTERRINAGCEELLKKVNEIRPKIHLFGHIHEAYGTEIKDDTLFINASVLNLEYRMVNEPAVFEFP